MCRYKRRIKKRALDREICDIEGVTELHNEPAVKEKLWFKIYGG